MNRFSITRAFMGGFPLVVLTDHERGLVLRVAERGATVVGIEVPLAGGAFQVADGFHDEAELAAGKSARFAIMAPFANRIVDGRYRFDGVEHDMQPGVTADRGVRHGFLRTADFTIADEFVGEDRVSVAFFNGSIRPGVYPGYPFAIDTTIRFTLDADGITLQAVLRNVGDEDAPCFFGWHPYFRMPNGQVDEWLLQVDAASLVRTDAGTIPLPGKAAFASLDEVDPSLDFRAMHAIGATRVDNAYANLQREADGRARMRLRDPQGALEVRVWQTDGVGLVFTGDTVPREPRTSVAMEPMETLTNAFNRDDSADLVRLASGAERSFTCGIELTW
ncbi:aldose epimerase [Pinirhizobacter sp.]|jgi:aldose 1-epimerase|uniref:aldose 1-epimerase n=1 Tax=Pinirhizobacter sp. TaxID=2950432 RepID=UPI002F3EB784